VANPYAPLYHRYDIVLPSLPVVDPDGPHFVYSGSSAGEVSISNEHHGDPVGVAINGVLIFNNHTKTVVQGGDNEVLDTGIIFDFDNCGGHSDQSHRYHYHGLPICILAREFAQVPASGTAYMYHHGNASVQLGYWSATGAPSPLLGFAMDGFPIYGPYNATGHLQVAVGAGSVGLGSLDECNFDHVSRQYHFTPNYPFAPSCLVGSARGSFKDTLLHKGQCSQEVENTYCIGSNCRPNQMETCDASDVMDAQVSNVSNWANLTVLCVLVAVVFWDVWNICMDSSNDVEVPRYSLVALAVMPAVLMIVVFEPLLTYFYGASGITPDETASLNDASNGYLAATGVIYGLFTSNLMGNANLKYSGIANNFHEELSGCLEVVLCIKALVKPFHDQKCTKEEKEGDERILKLQHEIMQVIMSYMQFTISNWGVRVFSHDKVHLESLFSILPAVSEICQLTHVRFNDSIASKIMDALGLISSARARRHAFEQVRIHPVYWFTNNVLATSMFFGVLLLFSGSMSVALTMCYLVSIVIGLSTYIVVDTSCPYAGLICITPEAMQDVYDSLKENQSMELKRRRNAVPSIDSEQISRNNNSFAFGLDSFVKAHSISPGVQ